MPVTDTVTLPVVDVAGPVVAPVTDAVTPILEPVVPPVPPIPESVGPVVAPVGPVVAPVPDGIQPNVDIVVPPATGSADPDSAAPAADETTAAPDPAAEPTIAPDLVAGADDDAVASVVDVPTIETPAAATTGVDSTPWVVTCARDADRGAAVDGASARSVSRTTSAPRPRSEPIGPFPGGSNAPGSCRASSAGCSQVVARLSSSSPGDAPVAMLAVLTATAAAMFMLLASRHGRSVVALRARALLGRTSWLITPSVRDQRAPTARRPVERSILEGEPHATAHAPRCARDGGRTRAASGRARLDHRTRRRVVDRDRRHPTADQRTWSLV